MEGKSPKNWYYFEKNQFLHLQLRAQSVKHSVVSHMEVCFQGSLSSDVFRLHHSHRSTLKNNIVPLIHSEVSMFHHSDASLFSSFFLSLNKLKRWYYQTRRSFAEVQENTGPWCHMETTDWLTCPQMLPPSTWNRNRNFPLLLVLWVMASLVKGYS